MNPLQAHKIKVFIANVAAAKVITHAIMLLSGVMCMVIEAVDVQVLKARGVELILFTTLLFKVVQSFYLIKDNKR